MLFFSVFLLWLPCEQHLQIKLGGAPYQPLLLKDREPGSNKQSSGLNLRNQVDTLEELVASDDFTWGIVNYGAADYQLFSTSEVSSPTNKLRFPLLSKGGALQANL